MRGTWLVALLALLYVVPLQAQDITVEGGTLLSATLTIKPETVTVVVPPPPWECPPGWTCTPPAVVDPGYVLLSQGVAYSSGDVLPLGSAEKWFEDEAGEWQALGLGYNVAAVPGIDSVVFYSGANRVNRERLYPYGIWNERGTWEVEAGIEYRIVAHVYTPDGVAEYPLTLTGQGAGPPTPGLGYSNEPAGFTQLAHLTYQVHPEPLFNDLTNDPQFALVPAPGSPFGASDSAGAAQFGPELNPGSAPINHILTQANAWNAQEYNELFWGFWLKVSANHTVTTTGVNKVGFVEVGAPDSNHGGSAIYYALTPAAQDSFSYAYFTQGDPGNGRRWTCNLGRAIKAGQWHKLEHYTKLNTTDPGDGTANADGVVQVWVDGTLCIDVTDMRLVGTDAGDPNPARVFSRIKWNPTYSSPAPPETSYQYITDLYVSGKKSSVPVPPPGGAVGDTATAISYWFADPYSTQASWEADVRGSTGGVSHEGNDWVYASNGAIDHMTLDDSEGYAGLGKAVRMDYVYDTDECTNEQGSGCAAQRWTFALWNDKGSRHDPFVPYTEHWSEASFRNSPNTMGCSYPQAWGERFLPFDGTYTTARQDPDFKGTWSNPDPPCAQKFIQFNPGGTWERLMLIPCSHGAVGPECDTQFDIPALAYEDMPRTADSVTYCPDTNCYNHALTPRIYDGQWHRLRQHFKPSSAPDVLDGRYELWLDDELWADVAIATAPDGWHARLALGANKDHGGTFPHTEWTKWSHAIVWVDKPAWYDGGE